MSDAPRFTAEADKIVARLLAHQTESRYLMALVGAPGSGKSTLAEEFVSRLNAARPGGAEILPMDGYHFDDAILAARGRRAFKGAPDTFDVGGLDHMLGRLRARDEGEVAVPVFDRTLEISRAGARIIPRTAGLIVVEGNYLLLDSAPWNALRRHFDLTVRLDVPEAMLRARLAHRWQGYGLTPEEITRKIEENDLPNGRFVLANSGAADIVLVA